MTRYRRVEVGTWHDERFRELSSPQPNAKSLWLYLLCGPRTTIFPGLVVAREAVIASDLEWPVASDLLDREPGCRSMRDAWSELERSGMVRADWKTGVIMLPKALLNSGGEPRETAIPTSPNAFKGWAKSWGDIPECSLKNEYLMALEAFANALGKAYVDAYAKAFAMPMARLREPARVPVPVPVFDTGVVLDSPSVSASGPGGPARSSTGAVDRGGARAAGARVPQAAPGATVRAQASAKPPPRKDSADAANAQPAQPQSQWQRAVQAWSYMRDRHRITAIALGLRGTPELPSHFGTGVHELNLKRCDKHACELYGEDRAMEKLKHAVDIACETALAHKHMDWFIPTKVWDPDGFARACDTSLGAAARGVRNGASPTGTALEVLAELEADERSERGES